MTAREEILARIRTALPESIGDVAASHASIARPYQRTGSLSAEARLELFIDRLLDYDTEIIQVHSEGYLPAAVAQALEQANLQRLLAASEFPVELLPVGSAVELDHDLTTAQIDGADGVITTCELAIASTGTIILVHGGAQGRRVITLLPDHHICVVRRNQVIELVPEAFAAIASESMRPITTISGPSATSDIEMTRIRGVHGPRRLTVILYGAP